MWVVISPLISATAIISPLIWATAMAALTYGSTSSYPQRTPPSGVEGAAAAEKAALEAQDLWIGGLL